jgi:hypothetical protein
MAVIVVRALASIVWWVGACVVSRVTASRVKSTEIEAVTVIRLEAPTIARALSSINRLVFASKISSVF